MLSPVTHPNGTALQWAARNSRLPKGVIGVETDAGGAKVGDGVRGWNQLPYIGRGSSSSTPLLSDIIDAKSFGFRGDGSFDNSPIMAQLLQHLSDRRVNTTPSGFYIGVPKVHFGTGDFYFSQDIELKLTAFLEGLGVALDGGMATIFTFAKGGFRINRANTFGGLIAPPTTGADATYLRGIYCRSKAPRPAADVYMAQRSHGVVAYARCVIENCAFVEFTGHGLYFPSRNDSQGGGLGTSGAPNSNSSVIRGNRLQRNGGSGYWADGEDSNANIVRENTFDSNEEWGRYSGGFLASDAGANHYSFNGMKGLSPKGTNRTAGVYNQSGPGASFYYLTPPWKTVNGVQVSAGRDPAKDPSQIAPGTDPTVWVLERETAGQITPNAEGLSYTPVWFAGIPIKDGGAFYVEEITSSCARQEYVEVGQPQPFLALGTCSAQDGTMEGNPNSRGTFENNGENGRRNSTRGWGATYTDPTTQKQTTVAVGDTLNSGNFVSFQHTDSFPGNGFHAKLINGNVSLGANHNAPACFFTGPATASNIVPGGTAADNQDVLVSQRFSLGGPVWRTGSAAPTTGFHAKGERVYNDGSVTSITTVDFWHCTVSGTPGTWEGKA